MNLERVKFLVDQALEENKDLFLIEFSLKEGNKIYVEVDGDKGVNLKECIRISRHIEHNLDREEEDFSLEVTSPDLSKPLTVLRQYKKNIGRILTLKTVESNKYEGKLTQVENDEIVLEWKTREKKPIGKGKVTVVKTAQIKFNNIQEAKVKIIF